MFRVILLDAGKLFVGERTIECRQAVGGSALEHGQVRGLGADDRDGLDGRRAGADHGHPLAGKFHRVMRPQTGVLRLPLEPIAAVDARELWRGHRADRGAQKLCIELATIFRRYILAAACFFFVRRRPPRPTPLPYTTLFRSFYLTRARRQELAATVHPLLATRGVPGTHDIPLLNNTLDALLAPARTAAVSVPRFDKARDDRCAPSHWDTVVEGVDIVLLEGWCLGARPETAPALARPVNRLEREEDPDGAWREYVNSALRSDYLPLYERVGKWVMLAAPSFDCVYHWRLEQERKLALSARGDASGVMTDLQLARFVQFYQRLTEQCIARLPTHVDYLYTLDAQRQIVASRPRWEMVS